MEGGGKVALVTAADTEVGVAIAQRFGREGYGVAACSPSSGGAQAAVRAVEEAGGTALAVSGDVRDRTDAARVVDAAVERFGRIDALVNFGAMRRVVGTIMDISDEEFEEELATDLKGVICLSRAAIPRMAEGGGGAIVNLSSIARAGVKGRALRSASKAALATLTRSMALDHAHQKIRVNALLVGPTLGREFQSRPEELERLRATAPLGEIHTPVDVAAAVYFLASDEARYITGVLLPLDAGRSLPTF